MQTLWKTLIAGFVGLLAIGATAAYADHKPAFCDYDHDHRSHDANYYNYYPADKYSRAGPYRGSDSGFNISLRIGDTDFDKYDRYDRDHYDGDRYGRNGYGRDRHSWRDRGRHNGYNNRDGRIVKRKAFDTRYRATIVLTEEFVRGRRGPDLVCTVRAYGPDAHHVSSRSMYWVARNNCSRNARVRVYA